MLCSYKQSPNSYLCSLAWLEALAQGINMNAEHFGMHNLMAQMTIVVKLIEIFIVMPFVIANFLLLLCFLTIV